ncbi:MAG: hypothetical protein ACRDT6_18855 [Micromonosporaceae bacterium]
MTFETGRSTTADPAPHVASVVYHCEVVGSSGMTQAVKRTLSMRPEVDRMLAAHVRRTPGTTLSSTVNAALVEYLETAALDAYRRWDAEADADERAALDALAAHDDRSWAAG